MKTSLETIIAYSIVAPIIFFIVMSLWNAVIPNISGLKEITYLQTIYLTVLLRILFK